MNIQAKFNYFGKALHLRRTLLQDLCDNPSKDNNEPYRIPEELPPLCKNRIDDRKLFSFQMQKNHALRIAKELDFDVRIEASNTHGFIEFISDNILINETCNPTIRNWFLNMLRHADDLWFTITEKYDQNVISLTFFFDLSKHNSDSKA